MHSVITIASGDAKLATRVDGADHLPWVVLSNSLATDLTMWDAQIGALMQTHRVLRYDTRGHGQSSAPVRAYGFVDLVSDIVTIMDRFDIAQADVVGLSMGGMTALGLGLDHPHRVRRLVCANARAVFPPAGVASWDQRASLVEHGGMAAVVEDTIARWFTEETRQTSPHIVDHARRMILGTSPDGYRSCTEALKQLDYFDRLPDLACPALFLAGETDAAAPPEVMQAMAAAAQDGHFVSIAAAAHLSNMERPQSFSSALASFLA